MCSRLQMCVVCLTLLAAMVTLTQGHLCIRNPEQRLRTANDTWFNCYQNTNPPCGKDFPDTPTENPKVIKSGSEFSVHLNMPFTHYNKDFPGKYTIKIKKINSTSTEDFTLLGQWPDGTLEDKYLVVKFPSEPGKYLLQAIYAPHGRTYYSCADVTLDDTVQAEALSPNAEYPPKAENGAVGTHYSVVSLLFVSLLVLLKATF
ncbi:uncharacterized protein LOC131931912 [Physella acuta]|uniref:uncharacterized protein LOC131931912 n=1 Tax=Physella acuta TaxID=109671 RepID=UPI0027DB3C31|nr:uncharacterized protein LOC131931912 [Physella acuta]